MASTELVVAFEAKIDGLTTSLRRVTDQVKDLQNAAATTGRGVQDSVDKMDKSFVQMAQSLATVRNAFLAFMAINKLTEVVLAVDDLNSALNRLKSITGSSTQGATDQLLQLAEIAARTGQPLTEMVNQFQRFYVATASLGSSSGTVQQLVGVLAGFAQLSGQKPQEAAAAVTQLSQALASGRLNGDELKSIMENMPQLAIAISRELGVSVGELRKMGEEGKLIASEVMPAILRAGNGLNDQLRDLPKSLRQGWQIFLDGAILAISAADRAIGATAWLSRFLQSAGEFGRNIAGNIERSPLVVLTDQTAGLNAELERARDMQRRLLSGEIAGAGAPNARALDRQIAQIEGRLTTARQQIANQTPEIAIPNASDTNRAREGIVARAGQGAVEIRSINESANPADKARREQSDRLTTINRQYDATMGLAMLERTREGQNARIAEAERGRAQNLRDSQTIYNRELASAGAGARAEAERQAREDEQRTNSAVRAAAAERERAAVISRAGGSGIDGLIEAYARWDAATENSNSNYQAYINTIIAGTGSAAVLFDGIIRQAEVVAQSMIRLGRDSSEALPTMTDELTRVNTMLVETARAAGTSEEAIAAMTAAMTAASTKGAQSLELLRERADTTWNDIAAKGIKTFASDLSGAIVDFATGAQKNFGEMAASFLTNIAKMILNMLLLRAIASSLGSLGMPGLGNMVLPGGGIPGRMSGGPVTAGQTYVVGEARPELFTPGASGYITPRVPGGEGGVQNNITIINNSKAQVSQSASQENGSGGVDIQMMVEDAVNAGMASGRFDRTLGSTFGVRRVGRN